MTTLIGGFSENQYKGYLFPTINRAEIQAKHWVSYFCIAQYPLLVVLINRLAYFLTHGGKDYLTNVKLFEKFKTHDFKAISSQEELKVAKRLFKCFQSCIEIDQGQLDVIKADLKQVKQALNKPIDAGEETETTSPDSSEGDVEEPVKNHDKITLPDETSPDTSKDKPEAPEEIKKIPSADSPDSAEVPKDNTVIPSQPDPTPHIEASSLPEPTPEPDPEGGELIDENEGEDPQPVNIGGVEGIGGLEEEENGIEEDIEPELESLPENVEAILNKPFPLKENQSILDLYKKGQKDVLETYRKDLHTLLAFEKRLAAEEKQTDERFTEYMEQLDQAFQRGWDTACEALEDLNKAFRIAFLEEVEVCENGDVICTPDQIDWAVKRMTRRFRALFELAFDASSMEIQQKAQVAELVRRLMGGEDAQGQMEPSLHFIRLRGTHDQSTPKIVEKGVSIFDRLFSTENTFETTAAQFVNDWLKLPGTTLKIPNVTLHSGESSAEAKEWVSYVRDAYTAYVLGLSEEAFTQLLNNVSQCPVIAAIRKANPDIQEPGLPQVLLERMFVKELANAEGNPVLHAAIQHMIDQAHFANPVDLDTLVLKGKRAAHYPYLWVESLIRIRVLYLMIALSRETDRAMTDRVQKRVSEMYDPLNYEYKVDQSLVCKPSQEREFVVDAAVDRLSLRMEISFQDPQSSKIIGSAQSTLDVSSFVDGEDKDATTEVVELKDLRFSIYSSAAQRDFLAAQIDPQRLIDCVEALNQEVSRLEILNRIKTYRAADSAYQKTLSPWKFWTWKPLDPTLKMKEDGKDLRVALRLADHLVIYQSVWKSLIKSGQLTRKDDAIAQPYEKICRTLKKIASYTKKCYSEDSTEEAQKILQNSSDLIWQVDDVLELSDDEE